MISIFDENIKKLLCDILKQSIDSPVKRKKFRLNNIEKSEYINFLENEQVLRTEENEHSHKQYIVSFMALYLADCKFSHATFKTIDDICKVLRDEFEADENDDVRVPVTTILNKLNLNLNDFLIGFNFLNDYITIGRTTDLTAENAYLCPNERFFEFRNFIEIPEGMMKRRHPEMFNFEDPNKKIHGNTDINSSKREAVLRAAIAVLAEFPDQCRAKSGKVQGNKIAILIEQKSTLLFPQYDGEPPLAVDKISREINKSLKLINKKISPIF